MSAVHAIVVGGGGSAGAVLARRLSEDNTRKVLLLEAGKAYRPNEFPRDLSDADTPRGAKEHSWGYLPLPHPRPLQPQDRRIRGARDGQAEHAAHLVRRTALAENIHARAIRPVLHGDNGPSMKGTTVLAMLAWLGITPSHSRPQVSDDNAFAEALFRTAKYRPDFPAAGFADLLEAQQWAARFVHWYNHEHRHSGIRYVTPAQRPCRRRRTDPRRASRPVPARTRGQSTALERANPQLDPGRRRHPQPRARQHRHSGHNAADRIRKVITTPGRQLR